MEIENGIIEFINGPSTNVPILYADTHTWTSWAGPYFSLWNPLSLVSAVCVLTSDLWQVTCH